MTNTKTVPLEPTEVQPEQGNACPRCGEGLYHPRVGGIYCEECGWPESDFEAEGEEAK